MAVAAMARMERRRMATTAMAWMTTTGLVCTDRFASRRANHFSASWPKMILVWPAARSSFANGFLANRFDPFRGGVCRTSWGLGSSLRAETVAHKCPSPSSADALREVAASGAVMGRRGASLPLALLPRDVRVRALLTLCVVESQPLARRSWDVVVPRCLWRGPLKPFLVVDDGAISLPSSPSLHWWHQRSKLDWRHQASTFDLARSSAQVERKCSHCFLLR